MEHAMDDVMTKLYPSQIRYYDENPTITFRVKKQEKKKLTLLAERSGKTIPQLVREALLDAEKSDSKSYKNGFADGYEKAEKEWKIWFYCKDCGEKAYIYPNSDLHKVLVRYMSEHGWRHEECPDNKQD